MPELTLALQSSIESIDRARWNALADQYGCPFLSWEFLALLEASGAVSAENGWNAFHAVLKDGEDWVACAPFYAVVDEAGQFTWDGGMDEAAAACGLRWFPKLVGMVPFTPSPVWRPMEAAGRLGAGRALVDAVEDAAREGGFSGLHLQWIDPGFAASTEASSAVEEWIDWRRQAYRWTNPGYADFSAFLGTFSKNMRRNVLRERAGLAAKGFQTRIVPASEGGAAYWDLMADYYERTNDKFGPWAARFLPRRFFELAPEYLDGSARFSAAFAPGSRQPVALALLFEGKGGLWGRYWGARSDVPSLHFEACYYRPIEYAIGKGLPAFDPGMGGHHKARRGFRAVMATSLHRVFEPRLAAMFARAVGEASAAEAEFAERLNEELPFRSDGGQARPGGN